MPQVSPPYENARLEFQVHSLKLGVRVVPFHVTPSICGSADYLATNNARFNVILHYVECIQKFVHVILRPYCQRQETEQYLLNVIIYYVECIQKFVHSVIHQYQLLLNAKFDSDFGVEGLGTEKFCLRIVWKSLDI